MPWPDDKKKSSFNEHHMLKFYRIYEKKIASYQFLFLVLSFLFLSLATKWLAPIRQLPLRGLEQSLQQNNQLLYLLFLSLAILAYFSPFNKGYLIDFFFLFFFFWLVMLTLQVEWKMSNKYNYKEISLPEND